MVLLGLTWFGLDLFGRPARLKALELLIERCVGVTTWGITDDRSWIPSFFSGYGAALLFDEAYQPKPAVAAMTEAWTAPAP